MNIVQRHLDGMRAKHSARRNQLIGMWAAYLVFFASVLLASMDTSLPGDRNAALSVQMFVLPFFVMAFVSFLFSVFVLKAEPEAGQ